MTFVPGIIAYMPSCQWHFPGDLLWKSRRLVENQGVFSLSTIYDSTNTISDIENFDFLYLFDEISCILLILLIDTIISNQIINLTYIKKNPFPGDWPQIWKTPGWSGDLACMSLLVILVGLSIGIAASLAWNCPFYIYHAFIFHLAHFNDMTMTIIQYKIIANKTAENEALPVCFSCCRHFVLWHWK